MTKSNDGKNGKNSANNRNGKQDYEVGYGKPPVHGQIKPGEVRNPKGRPRKEPRIMSGEQVRNDVLAVLEEKVTVNVRGVEKEMPLIHTILKRATLEAAKGDYRWGKLMIDLWQQLIDSRTTIIDGALAEVFKIDARFEEEAQANPEQVKEIYRRRTEFRSSSFVLQAFRQLRLPMPHSGKLTKAELELACSIDLPDDNWFNEFDDFIK